MTWLAQNVVSVTLEAIDGHDLPDAEAGAHVDVKLNDTLSRSYSIVRCEGKPVRYEIAVAKDAGGRGGSRHVHETLRAGDTVQISAPRNLFPIDRDAQLNVLIAGGIGITPLWSMVRQFEALGRAWVLHYAARDRHHAAYLADIESFVAASAHGRIETYFDKAPDGRRMDVTTVVREVPAGAHVYCCGPKSMLDAFEAAAAGLPAETVHLERFAPLQEACAAGEFTVALARSGQSFRIPADRSILDVLLENGVDVPFGCMQGACGMCEVGVLDGKPLHLDMLFSDEDKATKQSMLICCSRSATNVLTLDA
ncbi:2Fe-2S iron-sulfur cluster binding domain-containing protein [Paraburkholderia sp. CNPSo 3157]|uniref:2Fe-2S iron-sulfur cluster binding domain-containing protein n=1 Tax=Paraburkholderia franconis TaxID=2654983 RepID=A0A7X1NHX2_9BURK|nr:PDR/VanB family oxidoreductase [Paraburkholderia franconis]MPW22322.1 2Fe-2S iron-sulfur cluster binding domain-containing protein [Paraburkholderia franconis]